MSTVDYSYVQADNTRGKKDKEGVFTLGALWPIGAWGPRRDLIAKRMICLLTKINSSTNTWNQNQMSQASRITAQQLTA